MQGRDTDPTETREWVDALEGVIEVEGAERAHYLLERVLDGARRKGAPVPYSANTPYLNTIPPERAGVARCHAPCDQPRPAWCLDRCTRRVFHFCAPVGVIRIIAVLKARIARRPYRRDTFGAHVGP